MDHRFGYAVDKRFLPVLLPLGFRSSTQGVTVTDDGDVDATFGFLTLRTRLDNIDGAHITRDYRWWTAIGARLSFVDARVLSIFEGADETLALKVIARRLMG